MSQFEQRPTMPVTPHATPTHESWPGPGYGTVLTSNNHDYSDASVSNRVACLHLELGCLKQRIRWLEEEVRPFLYAQDQTARQSVKLQDLANEACTEELDAFIEEFTTGQYHE